ncbi:hypothetical protein V7S43_002839 [Phytophthora oleae]|uniref:HTH myb-type domain-containing protein n=1 Tax=Phytophthora oleae TaxID=2107226 RepID=A0ABD3G2K9_9STRA
MYRYGSWKFIVDYVGTRTERQVMSHAQSIHAKRKRDEKRGERQSMAKARDAEQTSVVAKLAKTTAGGRVNPSPAKVRKLMPATDTLLLSQEARHSLELPFEETAKESSTLLLSTSKSGGNSIAPDSPLCSPPQDIMIGSFFSDDDLFELIDTPSPPMGKAFTL